MTTLASDATDAVFTELTQRGVPITVDQAYRLTEALMPRVNAARASAYRAFMLDLARQVKQAGIRMDPEPMEPYPAKALYDAICQVCRLTPRTTDAHVQVLDRDTGKLVSTPVMISKANQHDQAVVDRIGAELARRVTRHIVQAGRQAVASTIHNGSARHPKTAKPVRVGYARVLSGRENCALCTMLASRGPVYRDDTVVKRRDGRRYHDGCDCVPVLVVDGQPWAGQDAYERLEAKWRDVTWVGGKPAPNQWRRWRAFVEGGRLNARDYAVGVAIGVERGSAPPKRGGLERKHSKATIRSAVTGANPTGDTRNCVRCVNAWALRRQGYNVVAAPGVAPLSAEQVTEAFWHGGKGRRRPVWVRSDTGDHGLKWEEVLEQMASVPADSWGFLRYKGTAFPHVTGWEKRGPEIVLVDPQLPETDLAKELERAVAGSIRWVNLKGYTFRNGIEFLIEGVRS
ncbi:VG15 protein [Corynebacterium uterequi]|nr:hypothetical protein [Corynebacterium uterequi]